MVSPILFVGGEDIDFTYVNSAMSGAFSSSNNVGQFSYNTSGGQRGGYARMAIGFEVNNAVDVTHYLRAPFTATTQFWVTYRLNCQTHANPGSGTAGVRPFRLVDSNGVERIRVNFVGAAAQPNDTFNVFKVDAAGTTTQLGSTSTNRYGSFGAPNSAFVTTPDKIDVFVNYAVAGQIIFYCNGVQTFNYSGDITTNSTTTLGGADMGQHCYYPQGGAYAYSTFSEVVVSTRDTRSMSLVTQAPTAFGNIHTFDSGTVANISASSMSTGQLTPNYSGTAGQLQEFQVTPVIPSGSFSVLGVVQKVQATIGNAGPTQSQFVVRTGNIEFTTSNISVANSWTTYSNIWEVNPNTNVAWQTSELAASSNNFNIGVKSIT